MNKKIAISVLLLAILAVPLFAEDAPRLRALSGVLSQMGGQGVTWQLTTGNTLPSDWLVETSDTHPGKEYLDTAFNAVDQAQRNVDMILLGPFPDGDFLERMTTSIERLSRSGRPVVVRIIFGQYNATNLDINAFIRTITSRTVPSPLTVMVGAMQSCAVVCPGGLITVSFNHSKVIVVDDKTAVVGGHNLFTNAYLREDPIFELSMKVEGPAAQSASNFANLFWQYGCSLNYHGVFWRTYASTWRGDTKRISPYECSYYTPQPPPPATGTVAVMGVGRTGWNMVNGVDVHRQWSEVAMEELFGGAQQTIRLSQQDVAFNKILGGMAWNGPVWDRIAEFMLKRRGHVYLLMSNKDAKSIDNTEYSWGISPLQVAQMVKSITDRQAGRDTTDEVCRFFHVASVARQLPGGGSSQRWPSGRLIGNHTKSYIVDDRVIYIGSHNLYPTASFTTGQWNLPFLQGSLQEYGYLIEDTTAGQQYLKDYWNPLWTAARPFAVSGDDAPKCGLKP